MEYRYDQPLPSAGCIDISSVAGFAMAELVTGALVVGVKVRGWLGFAGSAADFAVVTVWLTMAGLLSARAFQRADGWWPLPAAAGVILSVVIVVALVVLAVIWLLVNFPNLVTAKRGGGRKLGTRRR